MSPETRAFLDTVRLAEDPTPEDQQRVLSAVRAAVATGAVVGAGMGASKAAKLLGGVASGVKVGGLVLGLSAAAWIASGAMSTEPVPRTTAVVPHQLPTVPASEPKSSATTAFQRSPEALASPAAEPKGTPRAAGPARSAASTSATTPSLRDEITLLAEVQAALARGDGATALRRLDEHATGDRRLLAERRAARILALCSLGRAAEAAQAAQGFFREYPSSVQRTAVERSCAGKTRGPR